MKATYLDNHRTTYGYLPLAIVHSLPRALFFWSLVAFAGQAFGMALRVVHPAIAMVSIVFLGIIAFAIRAALYPGQKSSYEESGSPSSSWCCLSSFSRSKAVDLEGGF